MTNLFQHANSCWVKYSEYEIKKASDGTRYIKPASKAKPIICDPLEEAETLVIDALNVGLLAMNNSREKAFTAALMEFVHKYGLLGFITALPTTPHFLNYDAAYLPKNHFIKEEAMGALDYAALFFPFEKPDFRKTKDGIQWSVSGDNEMIALTSAYSDKPVAVNLSFGREYAERYDWLFTQFRDLSFSFLSSFFYYEDYDKLDKSQRDLYRLGMTAFGGIAPTYRIALLDKPTNRDDQQDALIGSFQRFFISAFI